MKSKNCAIIPAFNAGNTLKSLIEKLQQVSLLEAVIVVNDGSTDDTESIAQSENVIYIYHGINQGKGAALRSGFRKALNLNYDFVVTIDADLQHNPDNISNLFRTMEGENLDLVVGSRMEHIKNMPWHRVLSNKMTSKLIAWRLNCDIRDSQSGFRLIKSNILKNIKLTTCRFETETELLMKAVLNGYRIGFTSVDTIYEKNAISSIRIIDIFRFIRIYIKSFTW